MVIRIEMLNGKKMGKKKGKKRVSFGGGISAHLALFFSPAWQPKARINYYHFAL